MVVARFLGAGQAADAFFVAFRIPNLLRELFAEGSMSAGFIPVFTEYVTRRGRFEAERLAQATFTVLTILLVGVVGLGLIFTPQIVRWIAPGFSDNPEQYRLAIALTRIMLPFLFFVSIAALAMGILNSVGRFGPPAFASTAFNVVGITTLLVAFWADPVYATAVGVALGGAAQCLVQFPALRQEKLLFSLQRPLLPLHPGVIQMGRLIVPTLIGLSVVQVNLLVNTSLASRLAEGSVSYLYYAMRLIHLPLGLFAITFSTALLPSFSRQAAAKEIDALRQTLSRALRLVFFVTAPAMIGLIALRIPIIHLLFEHGRFDAADTAGTADAVLFYAIGLWAFAGVRIVVPVFYALQDTRTPVKIAIVSMLANIALCLLLISGLQHRGLALATALSAMVNFLGLFFVLRQRIVRVDGEKIFRSHLQTLTISLLAMLPAFWVGRLQIWQDAGQFTSKSFILIIAILISAFLYMGLHASMKSEEADTIIAFTKSKLFNVFARK
jgi:putative peptidoglycan lipid II flippase